MVLKNRNIESIMDYLVSNESVRSKKEREVVVVDEVKNVELVEELLDLEDVIKRERGKILDLEQQIKNYKGLTDLQFYQQYLRGCAT